MHVMKRVVHVMKRVVYIMKGVVRVTAPYVIQLIFFTSNS